MIENITTFSCIARFILRKCSSHAAYFTAESVAYTALGGLTAALRLISYNFDQCLVLYAQPAPFLV